MKNIFFSLIFCTFTIYAESLVTSYSLEGTVTRISDGDTLTITDKSKKTYKIRLASIDAPEMNQDYGKQAKAFLSKLCFGKTVKATWEKKDRYGRYIATVVLDEKHVTAELLKAGYAWQYLKYSNDPDLKAMQKKAKADKKGLWADSKAIPPWEFRKKKPSKR